MKNLAGPVFLLCAFSLAGTGVISARLVSDKLGTFTIAAMSLFFALLFLLPLCGRRLRESLSVLSPADFLSMGVQALFGIFLFRVFLIRGLSLTSAGEAGLLTGATPAMTAVAAALLLRERTGVKRILGILAAVGGVVLIQSFHVSGGQAELLHFRGNMLVLCAAGCETVFNILSRVFATKRKASPGLHPVVQTAFVSACAFMMCLVPALFENPVERLSGLDAVQWLALGWYGVGVTGLAFVCWYSGIRRCGAVSAAAFSGMMPCTSMLFAVLVLGESITPLRLAGGALVVFGMAMTAEINRKGKNSLHTAEDTL